MTKRNKIVAIWVAVALGIGMVLALAFTVILPKTSTSTITSHGSLQVTFDPSTSSDITDGEQVVITDPSGTVIATGTLNAGAVSDVPLVGMAETFNFTVSVPGNLPRYGVRISTHGTVWESASEMKAGPQLSLDETTSNGF